MRLKHLLLLTALALAMPLTIAAENGEDKNLSPVPSVPSGNQDIQIRRVVKESDKVTLETILSNPWLYFTITNNAEDGKNAEVSFKMVTNKYIDGTINLPASFEDGGETYDVTSLAAGAFANQPLLTEITIPSSIKSLGKGSLETQITEMKPFYSGAIKMTSQANKASAAFYHCINLKKVTFAEGSQLEDLGEGLFFGCYQLEEVNGIPSRVTKLPTAVFAYCHKMNMSTFLAKYDGQFKEIGSLAFYRTNLPAMTDDSSEENFKEYIKYYPTKNCYLGNVESPEGNYSDRASWITQYSTLLTTTSTNKDILRVLHAKAMRTTFKGDEFTDAFISDGSKTVITYDDVETMMTNAKNAGVGFQIPMYAFYETFPMDAKTFNIPSTVTRVESYSFYGTGIQRVKAKDHTETLVIANKAFREDGQKVSMMVPADQLSFYATSSNMNFVNIAAEQSRNVTTDNFGTLCLGYDAVKPEAEDMTVYEVIGMTFDETDNTKLASVTIDETTDTYLKAGKAYIFQGAADKTYNFAAVDEFSCVNDALTADDEGTNVLFGKFAKTEIDEENPVYVMQSDNKLHLAAAGSSIGAYRAYLVADPNYEFPTRANSPKAIRFNFNDGATGIISVESVGQQDGAMYDLQGRRVNGKAAQKGIYVKNGKKVLVK